MKCEDIRRKIPELLTDDLPAADAAPLQEHLHSCSSCWREWLEMQETWARLGILREEQPGPELRRNFYQALEAAQKDLAAGNGWRQKLSRLLPARLLPLPALRLVAASLVVAAGFGIGFFAGGRRDSGQVERLSREVDSLQQQMTLSLLNQSSASARLQGISLTSRLQDPGPSLIAALLDTLDNDPSVNVRLSAVDALYLYSGREEVRTALSASLARQASPLVQIALIDLLVSLKEKQAATALKKLLNDKKIIPEVQQRAQLGISQII
jgi:predicted anti-sigma-YlaC factor YlaD